MISLVPSASAWRWVIPEVSWDDDSATWWQTANGAELGGLFFAAWDPQRRYGALSLIVEVRYDPLAGTPIVIAEGRVSAERDGDRAQLTRSAVDQLHRLGVLTELAEVRALVDSFMRCVAHELREPHPQSAATTHGAEPAWPEPPGPAAYRGLTGLVVETISSYTEADPVAILASFVGAFGVAVGPGPHAMVGATRHTARDYFVLVGRTAKSRKGDAEQHVRALLLAALPDWRERLGSGLSSGEGLIHAVRDARSERQPIKEHGRVVGYETVEVDAGTDDKRLLVTEPEFARVLRAGARQGNTLSPILRDAWDYGDLRVMTRSAPIRATGAHIGLLAHVTADELRAELPDITAANGFANRHVWLAVHRSRDLPEPEPFEGPPLNGLAAEVRTVVDAAQHIGRMDRDDSARMLWLEVYHELAAERPGLLGAIVARGEAHVLRLSLVYALLDGLSVVGVEHLAAALELWGYAERSALYIFGDALGDPVADTVLRSLRAGGELTRTVISGLFGRHESGARIDAALQLLLGRGLARCETRATEGRPTEVWTAAP